MRIFMPRFHVGAVEANLGALRRDIVRAADAGAELALFPELFLTGYSGALDPAAALAEFAALSERHPAMICAFGTISVEGRNRQHVYLAGREVARYDKVHLFRPNREHEMWEPGDEYAALSAQGWRIGMLTCNDVRFPEQARALTLQAGAELMICPAYWPWQRDHVWRALLQARAIENGVFVAGCSVSSVDLDAERFDGAGNYVFDPLGNPVYPSGGVYKLDRAALSSLLVDPRDEYVEISRLRIDGECGQ
jgi:omega-amidase